VRSIDRKVIPRHCAGGLYWRFRESDVLILGEW
jgi:hypothetical protein